MSKTASASFLEHLRGDVTTVANIYDIIWEDGTEFHFTDLDVDIEDFEGNDYIAFPGFDSTAVSSSSGLNVDNLDLTSFIESMGMSLDDIRSGKWANAEVKQRLINYNDHSMGTIILRFGNIGQITEQDNFVKAEVRGLLHFLANGIGSVVSLNCRARLFSTELPDACKLLRSPPVWATGFSKQVRPAREAGTILSEISPSVFNDRIFRCSVAGSVGGSEPSWDTTLGNPTIDNTVTWLAIRARLVTDLVVASVTDRGEFIVTSITDAPDIYLTLGKVEFQTGLNAGQKRVCKAWTLSSKEIITTRDFPFDISPGDTLSITAGCNKTPVVCDGTFDNWHNSRNENLTPTEDQVLKFQQSQQTL